MQYGDDQSDCGPLLEAALFAGEQHRTQTRKDAGKTPYINHLVAVAAVLGTYGRVNDHATLMAAYLRDTIEDTGACGDTLEERFRADVRRLVEEVSDDKSLPKEERKRRQIAHAPSLSHRAKQLKLADLTCNVEDVALRPAGAGHLTADAIICVGPSKSSWVVAASTPVWKRDSTPSWLTPSVKLAPPSFGIAPNHSRT